MCAFTKIRKNVKRIMYNRLKEFELKRPTTPVQSLSLPSKYK